MQYIKTCAINSIYLPLSYVNIYTHLYTYLLSLSHSLIEHPPGPLVSYLPFTSYYINKTRLCYHIGFERINDRSRIVKGHTSLSLGSRAMFVLNFFFPFSFRLYICMYIESDRVFDSFNVRIGNICLFDIINKIEKKEYIPENEERTIRRNKLMYYSWEFT